MAEFDSTGIEGLGEVLDGGSTGSETKPPVTQSASPDAVKLAEQAAEARAVAKFLADPEISAVLQARQSGKKVKVVYEEEQQTKPLDVEDEDVPSMDDPKAYAKWLKSYMLKAVDTVVQDRVKPLQQTLSTVQQSETERAQAQLKAEIQATREKYKDFDQYVTDMVEINKRSPGLKPEEYYVLAKLQRRKSQPPTTDVSSERPNPTGAKPPTKEERETLLGSQGFSEMVKNIAGKKKWDFSSLSM